MCQKATGNTFESNKNLKRSSLSLTFSSAVFCSWMSMLVPINPVNFPLEYCGTPLSTNHRYSPVLPFFRRIVNVYDLWSLAASFITASTLSMSFVWMNFFHDSSPIFVVGGTLKYSRPALLRNVLWSLSSVNQTNKGNSVASVRNFSSLSSIFFRAITWSVTSFTTAMIPVLLPCGSFSGS